MLELKPEQLAILEDFVESGSASDLDEALDIAIHGLSRKAHPFTEAEIAELRRRAELSDQGGQLRFESTEDFVSHIKSLATLATSAKA